MLVVITLAFGTVLLVGAEVLPKNIGVVYRRALQPVIVYPLWWIRRVLTPITWACNVIVRLLVRQGSHAHRSDEEIILLKEGQLDVMINGKTQQIGPGSIVFVSSNDEHGWKNSGTTAATYYVLRLRTERTPHE